MLLNLLAFLSLKKEKEKRKSFSFFCHLKSTPDFYNG